jgi:uncharacterized membrane protein (DUF2068 family)
MDWNLRACARKGHVTYRPSEEHFAELISAETPAGEAWRCLRCGTWVNEAPKGGGPATEAPIVLRGKPLRDATILRILAAERFFRGLLLALAAYAVIKFRSSQTSLRELFEESLPAAKPLASKFNLDLDHSPTIERIRHLLQTRPGTLGIIAALLFGYAAVQLVEGVGLWMLKRWGEYVAVVATAAFLPLEVYELTERITFLRVGALVVNVIAVVYLVLSKRLFGARGGKAAYEEERRSESLLEVEAAAGEAKL